jgi:hypothetical protein
VGGDADQVGAVVVVVFHGFNIPLPDTPFRPRAYVKQRNTMQDNWPCRAV